MTTRTRSIDCFFQDAPAKRPGPSQAPTVQKDANGGKVLTAAEILDKGTRSVEAITVIAVVVGLTVGGYALWRAFKAKAEEEEQEEAMIAAIVEEETMREYRRSPPDSNWGGPYNEASGQLADHYAKHGRGRLSASENRRMIRTYEVTVLVNGKMLNYSFLAASRTEARKLALAQMKESNQRGEVLYTTEVRKS